MKKYFWIMFTTLALAGSSCKKDFLELSNNPNVPSVGAPGLLISGALKTSAAIVNGGGYTMYACWGGYLSYSTGYQPNVALVAYQINSSSYDVWTAPYLNLANYKAIITATTEPYYQAIAKIMTVYMYEGLVDNYNNVPYTQALLGTGNLNPVYDNGSAIYDDLLKQLDAAIVLIQNAPITALNPGASDIMYGGKMTNWAKFANTLKLRLALRQSNVTAKTAGLKAAVAATQSIGYLDATNPALVNPGYLNSDANSGQQSPLWITYGYTANGSRQAFNNQYQANTYGATALSANGDPRSLVVYDTTGRKGLVLSTNFGQTTPPAGGAPSTYGSGVLKSATMSAVIMSAAEALFLQAEGVKSGYITGNDAALYNAGVTASFIDDGFKAAAATTYLANSANAYPTGGSDDQKEGAIITQKWKALAGYGALEAFNELRRTKYPNDIPVSIYPGVATKVNISRIPYPDVEYRSNAANVAAQGTVDIFNSKIFWAK
jgi:hypothetical protein